MKSDYEKLNNICLTNKTNNEKREILLNKIKIKNEISNFYNNYFIDKNLINFLNQIINDNFYQILDYHINLNKNFCLNIKTFTDKYIIQEIIKKEITILNNDNLFIVDDKIIEYFNLNLIVKQITICSTPFNFYLNKNYDMFEVYFNL